MQQNPESKGEKKPSERKTIEVIVGRQPDVGAVAPEKIRDIEEKLEESEVGGRSVPVYVQSPYTGRVYLVYLEYEGEWFTDPVTGQSFQVWY